MINPRQFLILISTMFSLSLCSQDSIKYFSFETQKIVVFTRIINEVPYFFNHVLSNNIEMGSQLNKIENDEIQELTWIYHINDSLDCVHLIDFWFDDGTYYFLSYSKNIMSNQKYISLGSVDIESDDIEIINSIDIDGYRRLRNFDDKKSIINVQNTWILQEYDEANHSTKSFMLLSIAQDNLIFDKYRIVDSPTESILYDTYYDEINERYYIRSSNYYYVLDKSFDFVSKQEHSVNFNDIHKHLYGSYLIGGSQNNLIFYERIRDSSSDNYYLTIREASNIDSIEFSQNYSIFNADEDCYAVRKQIREKYNYIYYSRSTVNNYNDNYGFDILVFDKSGNMLNRFSVNDTRPMLINSIDADENSNTISGVGQYFDDDETSFAFVMKVDNLNSILQEKEKVRDRKLITQNPINQTLLLENNYSHYSKYKILNIHGQIVKSGAIENNINITDFPSGYYIFQYSNNNVYRTEKFIKM